MMGQRHAMETDILVVGLGIVGTAIAAELATRGHQVLGVDARLAQPGLGASSGLTKIIRHPSMEIGPYRRLAERAHQRWSELDRDSEHELVSRRGLVLAGEREGPLFDMMLHRGAEVLEPLSAAARPQPWRAFGSLQYRDPGGGVLNVRPCLTTLRRVAEQAGATWLKAQVRPGRHFPNEAWVVGDDLMIRADTVVLCVGAWLGEWLPQLEPVLRLESIPQYWFEGCDREAPVIAWSDDALSIAIIAEEATGETRVVPWSGVVATRGGEHPQGCLSEARRDTLHQQLVRRFSTRPWRWLRTRGCQYTCLTDGDFLLDWVPSTRVFVASACEGRGFKMAPAVAEHVADRLAGAGAHPSFGWRWS